MTHVVFDGERNRGRLASLLAHDCGNDVVACLVPADVARIECANVRGWSGALRTMAARMRALAVVSGACAEPPGHGRGARVTWAREFLHAFLATARLRLRLRPREAPCPCARNTEHPLAVLRGEVWQRTWQHPPRRVPGLTDVVVRRVAAGALHSMALSREGRVFTWGTGATGSLGHGAARTVQGAPSRVEGLGRGSGDAGGAGGAGGDDADDDIVDIAAGPVHSLAVDRRGSVHAWGSNREGQLGLGAHGAGTDCFSPRRAAGPERVVAVAAGWFHSVALRADGAMLACGIRPSHPGGGDTFRAMGGTPGVVDVRVCEHRTWATNASGARYVWETGPWHRPTRENPACAPRS